jgi:hypothetical protein
MSEHEAERELTGKEPLETICARIATIRYTIDDNIPIYNNQYSIAIDDTPSFLLTINDTDSRYKIDDKRLVECNHRDGIAWPFTEREIKDRFGVDFIRTPINEMLIVEVENYEGIFQILNERYGKTYEAHLWSVRFHRVGNKDQNTPIVGLLQIKTSTWDNLELGDPTFEVKGRCKIVAKKSSLTIKRLDGDGL